MSSDLEPLSPREALELWLDHQRTERSKQTIQSYRYRIEQFVSWCEEEGIENLNALTGRDLYRFDSTRRAEDLTTNTLNNQLGTLQSFLSYCANIEAVASTLPAKVEVPRLTKSERTNEEKLSSERAKIIRENLARYNYASRDHVLFVLIWHTTARLGGIRALDVEDCYLIEEDLERLRHQDDIDEDILQDAEIPFLYFRHRPGSGTPLKNQESGERPVSLSSEVGELLQDYLEVNRSDVTDENQRSPLLSTKKGNSRMSKGAIRSRCNILTHPCRFGSECPHGRDLESCKALEHGYESRCPSARSPHPIRTGAVTHHLDVGWPIEVLAERANATPEVIRDHYDHPDPLKRMESRREYLDDLQEGT